MARESKIDVRKCLLLVYVAERVLLRFASWVIDDQGQTYDANFDPTLRKHLVDAIPDHKKDGVKRRGGRAPTPGDIRDFGLTLGNISDFFRPRKGDPPAPFGQRGPRSNTREMEDIGERLKHLGDQRNHLMHGRLPTVGEEALTQLVIDVLHDVRRLVTARTTSGDDLFSGWRYCLMHDKDLRALVDDGAAVTRKIGSTPFARRWCETRGAFVFVSLEPQIFERNDWTHFRDEWAKKAAKWPEFSNAPRRIVVDQVKSKDLIPTDDKDVLKAPFWRPARAGSKRVMISLRA